MAHKNVQELTIIRFIAFDKAPSIDIYYLTFCAVVTPQQIKATDFLAETFTDFSSPCLFFLAKVRDEPRLFVSGLLERFRRANTVPYLLAFSVSSHDTIHHRRLAGLCMCILFSNSIDLNVLRIVDVDELLVRI